LAEYGLSVAGSAESLLGEVDTAVIAAPSFLHKELGLMAAEKGVLAFVVKLMALSSDDARTLL